MKEFVLILIINNNIAFVDGFTSLDRCNITSGFVISLLTPPQDDVIYECRQKIERSDK